MSKYGVIFDLDGTLVDTSRSYDEVVMALVSKYSGKPQLRHELKMLREEGGFNDDWQATLELLRRREICSLSLDHIIEEGKQLYLSLASETEKLMVELDLLMKLRKIYPLFVVTGRPRLEYEPVWGERLNGYFEKIYCLDDIVGKRPKPSPDYLNLVMEEYNLDAGVYIGNSIDDMQAAKTAQLHRIGLVWDQSEEALKEAGAQITISTLNQLEKVFNL